MSEKFKVKVSTRVGKGQVVEQKEPAVERETKIQATIQNPQQNFQQVEQKEPVVERETKIQATIQTPQQNFQQVEAPLAQNLQSEKVFEQKKQKEQTEPLIQRETKIHYIKPPIEKIKGEPLEVKRENIPVEQPLLAKEVLVPPHPREMDLHKEKKEGRYWLVAVDGSKNSESAMFFAVDRMDKEKDTIFLITAVEEESIRAYMYGALVAVDVMEDIQNKKDKTGRDLLHKMSEKLHFEGVKNIRLLLGVTNEVGDLILRAIEKHRIDFCCIGRRGMGRLKRLFVGSVSSYVVEHAKCCVFVVKGEHGPQVEHETSLEAVKKIEEIERVRRIQQEKKELDDQEDLRKMESRQNRNLSIALEEQERVRRIEEEFEEERKKKETREAEKIGVVLAEEVERKRRIEEDKANYYHQRQVEFLNVEKD